MCPEDLLRAARDLESKGYPAEADRLRWLAACALPVSLDPLGPELRDAEASGDVATLSRLLDELARPSRSSRRAASAARSLRSPR